jgi:septum formation protein
MTSIVLASRSAARVALLKAAGVSFTALPSIIDERAVEAPLVAKGAPAAEIAAALAEKKALDVGGRSAGALVIGADQTLSCNGRRWSKPANAAEARRQIAELAGRTHELHSAVAVVRDDKAVWRHVETARLTMRPLTNAAIDAYLAEAGDAAQRSVGAYQIEGPGIRLFEKIEGDYFTVLGLPLLPLLLYLRGEGALSW